MSFLYFSVGLILLSVSYTGGVSSNEYGKNDVVSQVNLLQGKITAIFTTLKSEIDHKFNGVLDKLSDLQAIKHDMNILKKKISDFEKKLEDHHNKLDITLNEKLSKLKNNIIDRLEGYVADKIDNKIKLITEKIDAQIIFLPKIIDINNIADKLDALHTNQTHLEKHISCKPLKVSNDTTESVYKGITKKITEIQTNISELKNKTSDFNLNSFPKSMIKLKEKIDLLEKNMSNKTDTLQDKIADMHVINGNDKLKKLQTELNRNIFEKLKLIVNEAQGKVYNIIKRKLNVIEKNIYEIKHVTKHLKHASLDKKITNLEDVLKREMNKIIPTIKNNIENKLHALDNKLPAHFEDNLNLKLNAMEKNILSIKHNITCNVDVSNNTTSVNNNIPGVEKNLNKTTDASENREKDVVPVKPASAGCKEYVMTKVWRDAPYHRLGDKSLRHVPVSYDSAGGLASLEMLVRIKGYGPAAIVLSSSAPFTRDDGNVYYAIQIGEFFNQSIELWTSHDVSNINPKTIEAETPNILSPREFTAFFVNITNGSLKFGKEGGSPILELPDPKIQQIKYFSLAAMYAGTRYLYDCGPTL